MFDLKKSLRKITGGCKIYATDNIQETKDNLKVLGLFDDGPGGDGPMIKFNTHSGDLVDFVLGGDGQLRKYWFYNSKNQGEANSDLGSFFTGQP